MSLSKATTVLYVVIFYYTSKACDICGNYMGITPYDNKNSISFIHRYRIFNGYQNYQKQSYFFPTSAYKINHGDEHTDSVLMQTHNYSSKDYESYKVFELRFKYFISKRIEINTFIPLLNNKSQMNGEKNNNTNFGDVSINGTYHLITPKADKKLRHKLILGMGLKLATGVYFVHDNYSKRLPFLMQPGTGSWDGMVYVNYIMMSKKIGINVNTSLKINSQNRYHERMGNSNNSIVSVFYKLKCNNLTIYPSVIANYEFSKGLYIKKELQKNTQVNSLLVGPGLDIYYKSFSLNTSWQFTAFEKIATGNLKSAGRLVVGINYSFSKKEK